MAPAVHVSGRRRFRRARIVEVGVLFAKRPRRCTRNVAASASERRRLLARWWSRLRPRAAGRADTPSRYTAEAVGVALCCDEGRSELQSRPKAAPKVCRTDAMRRNSGSLGTILGELRLAAVPMKLFVRFGTRAI